MKMTLTSSSSLISLLLPIARHRKPHNAQRKIRTSCLGVVSFVALLFCFLSGGQAQELISNGTFSDGLTGWTTASWAGGSSFGTNANGPTSTSASSGNYAYAGGGTYNVLQQSISGVTNGGTYRLTFLAGSKSGQGSTYGVLSLFDGLAGNYNSASFNYRPTDAVFGSYTVDFVARGGTDLWLRNDGGGYAAYDNVSVTSIGSVVNALNYSAASGYTEVTSVLSGAGKVTANAGTGGLTLAAANTYSGGTEVAGGTLFVTGSGTLGASAGSVTVSNSILDIRNAQTRTGTITIKANGFVLSGDGSGSLVNNGGAFEFQGGSVELPLSGTGGMNITGGGRITSSNSYTGATTISATPGWYGANTFYLSHSNGLGDASGSLTISGGTVSLENNTLTRSGNLTISGGTINTGTISKSGSNYDIQGGQINAILAGTAGVTKSGAGSAGLAASNTYSGGTIINGGSLVVSSAGGLGDAAGTVTVNSGGTLYIGGGLTVSRTGNVTINGGSLTSDNSNLGTLSVSGGNFIATNAATLAVKLAGTGGLTVGGTGETYLWAASTYTGATVVNSGQLTLGGVGAISSDSALSIASGAAVNVTGSYAANDINRTFAGLTGAGVLYGGGGTVTINKASGSDTFSGDVQGGQGLIKSGIGTLVLAGSNSYSGATTVGAGTLRIVHGNALGATNGGTTVNQGGVLRLTATNNSGVALVGEAVTLVGGTNTNASFISERVAAPFVPTNTFQGKISLLDDARIDSLGNSTLVLTNSGSVIESTNNADLAIAGAGTIRLNSAISIGTGSVTKGGSGALYVAGDGTLGGSGSAVVLNSGNIDLGGLGLTNASLTTSGGIITNGTLTATAYNLNGGSVRAILGAGTVNATSGTTSVTNGGRLGAATVNVTGGTLSLGAAGLLATNAAVTVDSGQLSLGGNETLASLSGIGGTVALGAHTLSVGSGNSASLITGSGILTKTGAMTLTLSGNNTYSGGTLLNGGWLVAGHTNAFGTGSITVGSGTTLNLSDYRVVNLVVNNGGTILSTGQLDDVVATNGTTDVGGNNSTVAEVGGSATVNVSGSNVAVAAVSGGTLNVNASGAVVTNFSGGNIAISNGLSVALRGGNSGGVISGAGGIAKQGADTLTLSGANTYAGATTVEAGKLVVNGSINSATTVQSGATLGGSGSVASATIESGGTIDPGNSPGTLTLTNGLTWSGGGNYNWQIFGLTGTAGQANTWDLIDVTGGTWDITGLSSTNKFNINLWSLSGLPDTTGAVAGFDATQNYTWKILSSVGVSTNFNASFFNINTAAANGTGGFVGATGLFSLAVDGNNDLFLTYTGGGAAVPEPGTWAAGALLALAAGYARWRQRRDRLA